MTAHKVAREINLAIKNFVNRKPQHLCRIDVVVFQSKMLNEFQTGIDISVPLVLQSGPTSSNAATTSSSKSRLLFLENEVDPKHRILLYFTSNKKANIEKVCVACLIAQWFFRW